MSVMETDQIAKLAYFALLLAAIAGWLIPLALVPFAATLLRNAAVTMINFR